MTMSRRQIRYGVWIIALFLVAGGLLGLLSSVLMCVHLAQRHQNPAVIATVLSVPMFAWSVLTGIALWRGAPWGFQSAKLLFALQVPTFSVVRFGYEFSTLISLRLMIGNTTHHIGGNIGSSVNFYLLPQSLGFMFGINIVAVIVLLCLIRASRPAFTEDLGPRAAIPIP